MVASHETVEQIYMVVRKHVTGKQMELILRDLLEVPGNKSFRDTIGRLADIDGVETPS